MAAWIDMGGYGLYVWPAYLLTAVLLVGLGVASVRRVRALERDLAALDEPEAKS